LIGAKICSLSRRICNAKCWQRVPFALRIWSVMATGLPLTESTTSPDWKPARAEAEEASCASSP
jgi:hypothetical protein